jgi:hypothetical protein
MLPNTPGESHGPVQVTPRIVLRPAPGRHVTAHEAPPPVVLGDEEQPTVLSIFAPAEAPIEVEVQGPPQPPQVLGEDEPQQDAVLEYQPGDTAAYALLQEIHTPDGVVYDFTLPQRSLGGGPIVLGDEEAAAGALVFPVNGLVGGAAPAAGDTPAVLGIEDTVGGAAANVVIKRVLQVIKSPVDAALLTTIKHFEPTPRVLAARNGAWNPLEGAEAWRSLLPPGDTRRVLLYVHGFGSSIEGSGGGAFVPQLAASYDAVLGYDHPTVTFTPLENALRLLEMIPDDLRLEVDLVAHSRGGLVVRSLVELADWQEKLRPARLLTAGTPHAGTRLAEPERWDRLVSIGMTLGSWLATIGGGAFWVPKLLEFVLKAAAQGVFGLPGIGAMTPGSDFLTKLNAPDARGLDDRVRYAAVTSTFAVSDIVQQGFKQALGSLAAQAFMGVPNDMVVPTASATEIDVRSRVLAASQQLKVAVDHGSYFRDPLAVEFIKQQLLG